MPELKTCKKCGNEKSIDCFYLCTGGEKHQSLCKLCLKEYNHQRYIKNKEKIKIAVRDWQKANPEKKREYRKSWDRANKNKNKEAIAKWRKKNPEKTKIINQRWRMKNPEKARECWVKWYESNKEYAVQKADEWKRANPEKRNAIDRRASTKKRSTIKGRLNTRMSNSIRKSLHANKNGRHWESLVGYTVDQLSRHLEKQFKKGMDWSNYGTAWHIDHKIPISYFEFQNTSDLGFKKCWSLDNLQPLWAQENIIKANKITEAALECSGFFYR